MAFFVSKVMRGLHHRERGQVFFMVAALFAVFGGMSAVAIDLGVYMAARRDLQNAADAIALAASQDLPENGDTLATANSYAGKNGIELSAMTVTITPQGLPAEPNPKVRVDLEAEQGFIFARLIGIESAEIEVSATAIRTSPGGSTGLMPWSLLQEVKDEADPGDEVVLKYDSNNGSNGNFAALALDGNGASQYENAIKYGSDNGLCAAGVTDCPYPSVTDTKPGNMTGPTRGGTDYRILNTSPACDTWAEVVIESGGTHGLRSECNPFGSGGNPESLRVIVIPVIEELCNGSCEVTITEFVLLFLEGYSENGCSGDDCEIVGRFINSNTNYGSLMGVFDENTFAHFVRLVK